jgi:hypothetical protein
MPQSVFVPPDLPSKLTLAELARWLRVSARTARDQGRNGGLPAPTRVGRRLLWDAEEVARHLADRTEGAAHEA